MPTYRETPVTDATAHALLAEYFTYREASFPSPAEYVTTFPAPEQFVEPHGVFLVVEVEGEEVGCGGIRGLGDGVFEVKHLWLRPALQGRGLGRALLAELERRAVLLGASSVVLDTNASLEAAGGLYRSSGYEDVEPYNDNPNATNWYRKVLQREPLWLRTLGAPEVGDPRDGAMHQLFAEVPEARFTLEPLDENPDAVDAVYDLASPNPVTEDEVRLVWLYNYVGLASDIYGVYPDDFDDSDD